VAFAVAWNNYHRALYSSTDLFKQGATPTEAELEAVLTLTGEQREKVEDALSVLELDGSRTVFEPALRAHQLLVDLEWELRAALNPHRRRDAVWQTITGHLAGTRSAYESYRQAVNETPS
jgi:hypothetical protein